MVCSWLLHWEHNPQQVKPANCFWVSCRTSGLSSVWLNLNINRVVIRLIWQCGFKFCLLVRLNFPRLVTGWGVHGKPQEHWEEMRISVWKHCLTTGKIWFCSNNFVNEALTEWVKLTKYLKAFLTFGSRVVVQKISLTLSGSYVWPALKGSTKYFNTPFFVLRLRSAGIRYLECVEKGGILQEIPKFMDVVSRFHLQFIDFLNAEHVIVSK